MWSSFSQVCEEELIPWELIDLSNLHMIGEELILKGCDPSTSNPFSCLFFFLDWVKYGIVFSLALHHYLWYLMSSAQQCHVSNIEVHFWVNPTSTIEITSDMLHKVLIPLVYRIVMFHKLDSCYI